MCVYVHVCMYLCIYIVMYVDMCTWAPNIGETECMGSLSYEYIHVRMCIRVCM